MCIDIDWYNRIELFYWNVIELFNLNCVSNVFVFRVSVLWNIYINIVVYSLRMFLYDFLENLR